MKHLHEKDLNALLEYRQKYLDLKKEWDEAYNPTCIDNPILRGRLWKLEEENKLLRKKIHDLEFERDLKHSDYKGIF